jgi:hypothetical protein
MEHDDSSRRLLAVLILQWLLQRLELGPVHRLKHGCTQY